MSEVIKKTKNQQKNPPKNAVPELEIDAPENNQNITKPQ